MSTLTEQFLTWVADRPRTYADAMEAWRSTCPRLSIWEDALGDELVRLEAGAGGLSEARVVLTPRGQALLTATSPQDAQWLPAPVTPA
jgi:hypothetical protein